MLERSLFEPGEHGPAANSVALPGLALLQRFPMALLLLDGDGRAIWANERFSRSFDAVTVAQDAPVHLGRECPETPRTWHVPGLDGKATEVLVHCVPMSNARLLVLDDTPGSSDTIRRLQERVTQLEHDSVTDRLTGAWNRRYLDHVVAGELARARRYRQPVTAVMLDIDHFKRVNDTYGHTIGDSVLCELVATIRICVRAADVLVRWGGEEFLLVLPSTAHGVAAAAAEKVREAVAAHEFNGAGRVTISAGAAEYLLTETAEAWIARADQALYRAKEAGRNRVEVDPRGASDGWTTEDAAAIVQLVWRDSYVCGEPTIDAQHQSLFQLANELISASLRQAENRDAFIAALAALLTHVAHHFADEERILGERGYAGLAQHRRAHHALLARAGTLQAAALRGEAKTGLIVEFLAHEVVAHHLLTADRDFYPLFAQVP